MEKQRFSPFVNNYFTESFQEEDKKSSFEKGSEKYDPKKAHLQ
jgi:hypothetical protein